MQKLQEIITSVHLLLSAHYGVVSVNDIQQYIAINQIKITLMLTRMTLIFRKCYWSQKKKGRKRKEKVHVMFKKEMQVNLND
jgi:hypothetical protein